MKKWTLRGLILIVILAAGTYVTVLFLHSLSHESTDDAYVSGTIVPIAAEVKGRVGKVLVRDNQYVTAGTPLLEIIQDDYRSLLQERSEAVSRLRAEDREIRASVEEKRRLFVQSQANHEAAAAEEGLGLKELKRYDRLLKKEAVSYSQFDNVESRWKVARARKEAAAAAVAAAEAAVRSLEAKVATQAFRIREAETSQDLARQDLTKTVVTAPVSSRVAMKNVDPGKYVQPGQSLLSLVKEDIWVTANFKETQIRRMTLGQPVEVKVDAYPGVTFMGHIDSLQPGTGSVFSLLPPENATGNFVKVVQRIPVKIIMESPFDPGHPLWPGMSVVPTVDVSRGTGRKLTSR